MTCGFPLPCKLHGGNAKAAEQLATQRRLYEQEPRLGHELTAHRDLGFCQFCHPAGVQGELMGWRLLAMAERGVPDQLERRANGQAPDHGNGSG